MKIVVSDSKTGKAYQRDVAKEKESLLVGKRIGEKVDGGIIGLTGFMLEIAGGSDVAGFPMRKDITGSKRIVALLTGGTGVRGLRKGGRKAKRVSGSAISAQTAQVNAKISEYGAKPLEELGFVLAPKEKKGEKAGDKNAGAKK